MHDLALDERLAQDSYPVTELPLCQLRVMNDRRYCWLLLIPRRDHVSEVFDLDDADQRQLWHEATRLGALLKEMTDCDKINIATLGNVVAQLHVHVVARRRDDPAWPGPVWGHGQAEPYDLDTLAEVRDPLLAQLDGSDLLR
ncbi:HIT family protein [Halomonas sp. E19]|uniref:HIT family protein n=1 Tax=unclassified Halomonas TaxID=2609666 RepID=UPI0040343FC1